MQWKQVLWDGATTLSRSHERDGLCRTGCLYGSKSLSAHRYMMMMMMKYYRKKFDPFVLSVVLTTSLFNFFGDDPDWLTDWTTKISLPVHRIIPNLIYINYLLVSKVQANPITGNDIQTNIHTSKQVNLMKYC